MVEPIGIEEARAQIRMDGDASRDADLARYIRDAREWVETYTGQTLIAGDAVETFRVPGRAVTLRAWPIASAAALAIAVVDDDGTEVEVVGALDTARRPATIRSTSGWSMTSADQQLRVTVRAGYEPGNVPGNLRRAMLLLIAAYDADREGGELFAASEARARSLCRSFRRHRL